MIDSARACVMVFAHLEQMARELAAVGRRLADETGMQLVCVVVGDRDGMAERLAGTVDRVLSVRLPTPDRAGPEVLLEALHQAVRACPPDILLLEASRDGTQIAARLAQRLRVPCASDCTSLRMEGPGTLVIQRRAYGGRFLVEEGLSGSIKMATVRRGRFEGVAAPGTRVGSTEELDVDPPVWEVEVRRVVPRERSSKDIAGCPVVVGVGRGLLRREDLTLVERLAALLGGAVAGSRPITDQRKWLPSDRKVGLSGRTVKPRLYVACGISGQIEHVVGMRGARTVVAINKDPSAPIHAEADFSLIGDLYEIVPELIRALEGERSIDSSEPE